MIQLANNLQTLHKQKQAFVLVTLINIRGSAPQIEGAKMLVTAQGRFWGTVGGGKIEAFAIEYAKNIIIENAKSQVKIWNLQNDIGMSCGGEVSLFFDVNRATNLDLAIFGAGHISQELCRVLSTWTCRASVFDSRADWLERLPSASNIDKKLCLNMSDEIEKLSPGTFILCITQGHATDVPILFEAFKKLQHFSFIGVIGSDVKAKKIKSELIDMGIEQDAVARLVCPLGLPIGDNTPAEIAISVCAQLLAVRDQNNFRIEGGLHDQHTHIRS